MQSVIVKKSLTLAIILIAVFAFAQTIYAQEPTLDELKKDIETKNEELKKLEEEAQKYKEEVAEHQEKGKTLKAELSQINRTIGKLKRDIAISEQKLKKIGLEIDVLSIEIQNKEATLKKFRGGLAGLLQSWVELEKTSLLEIVLKNTLLSNFFGQLDYLETLNQRILASLDTVRKFKKELEDKKEATETKKKEEDYTKKLLQGRRTVLSSEQKERDTLLRTTKNQEKIYQALLSDQEKKIAALEDEIREIEDKIKVTIDPASLPSKGSGVLGWPLPQITLRSCYNLKELINCITQHFGYTSFAAVGGYGGKGHNGTDFRAAIGTPVLTAESGVVEAVGDTDIGCRGASYGKWILIKHPSNLSTLYAHLSSVGVSQGQNVARGERIGLSGKTGYATGPHLHFTVFASQAVRVESIRSKVCGRQMTLPIADPNWYLNPLHYL